MYCLNHFLIYVKTAFVLGYLFLLFDFVVSYNTIHLPFCRVFQI